MGIGSRLACGLSPVVQRGGRRAASHAPPLSLHRLLPLQPGTAHRKHLSQVPDYEAKYRDKLLRRAREAGVGTVEELKRQMAATAPEAEPQPAAKAAHTAKAADSAAAQPQKCAQDLPQRRAQDLPPSVKRLDQVMKTDLLGDKSGDEIGEIWTQYHATKDAVSAVIPAHTYQQLLRVARANPLFVLPLPRAGQGVEFFFLQFDFHQVHFTSLVEYKASQAQARPYLTLTHYTDYMDRGVVLMRGEIDAERGLLDAQSAQYLALQMQQFYVTGGAEKRRLLEAFNQRPAEFDYRELMEAAEKL